MIALPGGVGSPDVTKEAQVLVISFDIDASVSGRLEHFIFTKVLLFWKNDKKGLDKTNWHAGKHKMLSKLATQSFKILRLIARNPNFLRPKVPYFNVSRLHEVICIYVFRHTSLFMPFYRYIFLYMGISHCSRSVIKYQQKNDKHGSLKACWPKRELREVWTG